MSSSTYEGAGAGSHAYPSLTPCALGPEQGYFRCPTGGLWQAHGGSVWNSDATFEEGAYAGKTPSHS